MSKNYGNIPHFYWVDVLRGLAAICIVVFHYHHFYLADAFDRPSIPAVADFPYAKALWPLYSETAARAVQLFWLISGFVFAHVYLIRRSSFWSFSVARFARLYPLHFLTLLVVAGLQWISLSQAGHWQIYGNNDARHFILQIFFATNWSTLSWGLSFNGPIWSVSAEILVYFIFFACLPWFRKSPVAIAGLLCALCATWKFFQLGNALYISETVVVCAGYFFWGATLYSLRLFDSISRSAFFFAIGVSAYLCGELIDWPNLRIAGASTAILCIFLVLDQSAPNLGKKFILLGDISYSLYLVHVPLQMLILLLADLFFEGNRSFADNLITLPLYTLASISIAYIANQYLERPVGKRIRTRLAKPGQ